MEFIATQKFLLASPKKLRMVADVAKKMSPTEAVEKIQYLPNRGAEILTKVIKNALASAKGKGVDGAELMFKEIQIGEGPRLKRGRPVSKGRWHPYKRRMSHIRVVLTAKSEILSSKSETNSSNKNSKKEMKTNKKGEK